MEGGSLWHRDLPSPTSGGSLVVLSQCIHNLHLVGQKRPTVTDLGKTWWAKTIILVFCILSVISQSKGLTPRLEQINVF